VIRTPRASSWVVSCVALRLPGHPPRGLSHALPLGGCYVTGHDPSPAHAGGRVTADTGFPRQASFGLLRASSSVAQVSDLPRRHTQGACGGVVRAGLHRTLFHAARTDAGR